MFALDEYTEVPYSNRNYFIDKIGNVVDSVYHHVPKIKGDDGKLKVKLNWVNGFDYYDLAFVVCVSYYRPTLPFHLLLNEIEVCFSDGDYHNCNINNLYYKFKSKQVLVPGTENLYYIPYYTQYALDKEFNLYRLATLHGILKITWDRQSNGYWRNRKTENDFNESTGIMRHRAIGLVFIDYPNNPLKLQINHINGIKGDDRLDNLEWMTNTQNIIHAGKMGLLKNFIGAIDVKRLHDGEVFHFDSCKSASKELKLHTDLINEQLGKKTLDFIPTKGYLFKYPNEPWPIFNNDKKKYKGKYAIMAKNVFTDEVLIFNGLKDAHEKLKLSLGSITTNYTTNSIVPTSEYIFRDLSTQEWPKYTFYHLEVFKYIIENKKYPQSYFFINEEEKELYLFRSLQEIKLYFGLSNRALYRILKQKTHKSKYIYADDDNVYEENYTIIEFDYTREMTEDDLEKIKGVEYVTMDDSFWKDLKYLQYEIRKQKYLEKQKSKQ